MERSRLATAALRGDPAFDARLLDPTLRLLHGRLWQTLDHPENRASVRSDARSDDSFRYWRSLGSHLLGVLTGAGTPRAGLPNDITSIRLTVEWFRTSPVGLITAWDAYDGALRSLVETTESTYDGDRDTSVLIAGLLLAEWSRFGAISVKN